MAVREECRCCEAANSEQPSDNDDGETFELRGGDSLVLEE